MKSQKLFDAIGGVDDKYIADAAPDLHTKNAHPSAFRTKNYMRFAAAAACVAVFLFAATSLAAAYVQNSISGFYLRYVSLEDMAVADALAAQYGAKVYFDGLQSGDPVKQYFAINKLVEHHNEEDIRQEAITAITPFLTNEDEKLADAAAFTLSVLTQAFDDPRILRLADGSYLFTLFNAYSDYGSHNKLWRVQDGELAECFSFRAPHMYIRDMLLSPDATLLAIQTGSNKSEYIIIYDAINGFVSTELIDNARILAAKDMGYAIQQRMDFENYSGGQNMTWIDSDTLEFEADLRGDAEGLEEFAARAIVRYDFRQKHMTYRLITE